MSLTQFAARLATTAIPWQLARFVSWVLALNALATGWDYINTPPTASAARSLTVVEKIATLHTWGILFLVAGGLLALGLLVKRHALVWVGHLFCAGLYVGFLTATVQAVLTYMQSDLAKVQGPIWRGITSAAVVTVLHVVLCWLRGPIPRKGEAK